MQENNADFVIISHNLTEIVTVGIKLPVSVQIKTGKLKQTLTDLMQSREPTCLDHRIFCPSVVLIRGRGIVYPRRR